MSNFCSDWATPFVNTGEYKKLMKLFEENPLYRIISIRALEQFGKVTILTEQDEPPYIFDSFIPYDPVLSAVFFDRLKLSIYECISDDILILMSYPILINRHLDKINDGERRRKIEQQISQIRDMTEPYYSQWDTLINNVL